MPPPCLAVFAVKVHLINAGLLFSELYTPAPLWLAKFSLKMQSVSTGLLSTKLHIPPPLPRPESLDSAEFLLNVQFVNIGELP
jgi:hypothetical protein